MAGVVGDNSRSHSGMCGARHFPLRLTPQPRLIGQLDAKFTDFA